MYPLLLRLEKGGSSRPGSGTLPWAPDGVLRLTEQGREELAQFHASFQAMAAAVARLPGFAPEKEETP